MADHSKSAGATKAALDRKREAKASRRTAIQLVEQHTRESGIAPGFDYARAVLELSRRFTFVDIAKACSVTENAVDNWTQEKSIPRHDRGERLWILYVETFSRKPPLKKPK